MLRYCLSVYVVELTDRYSVLDFSTMGLLSFLRLINTWLEIRSFVGKAIPDNIIKINKLVVKVEGEKGEIKKRNVIN